MELPQKNHSNAENQSSAKTDKFAINVSEVAIAASFVVAGLFLTGYTYIDTYFNNFGLSALEINVTYHAAAALGFNALIEIFSDIEFSSKSDKLWGAIIIVLIALFHGLAMLMMSYARFHFRLKGLYVAVAILFFATCWIAVVTGAEYAQTKAIQLTAFDNVVIAHCKLKSNNGIDANIKNQFEEKSRLNSVRKIIESGDMIYFTYKSDDGNPPPYLHAIAISKSDIAFCRFVNYEKRFNADL